MAIRYNRQLKSDIRKAVQSFNAKIRRLQAKGVSSSLLPSTISSREIKAGITNRRDLRKRLAQLQEFSSAGEAFESEGGLVGTNVLFEYRQGEANKAIKALDKEFQKVIRMDSRYPMMQTEYASNLQAKMEYLSRDVRKLDLRQIQIFNKNLLTPEQKAVKDEQFYANYNKMIFFDAYKAGLDPRLIREISEKLERFTPAELLEMYNTEPAFKAVSDIYMKGKAEAGELSDEEAREQFEALNARIDEKLAAIE